MFQSLPKMIFLLLSVFMLTAVVHGAKLKCQYENDYGYVGIEGREAVYQCAVSDSEIFTGDRVTIDSAEGKHHTGKIMEDVKAISIKAFSSVKYMPKNLENIFNNMIAILIDGCNLQEIKQSDIKVFPSLQYLSLFENEIATIDKDLFKFNPELRTIYLNYNRISHIDPNVFDHLNHLNILFLNRNKCKNDFELTSEVLELIEEVRNGGCLSSDEQEEKMQEKVLMAVERVEEIAPNGANKNSFILIVVVYNFISLFILI